MFSTHIGEQDRVLGSWVWAGSALFGSFLGVSQWLEIMGILPDFQINKNHFKRKKNSAHETEEKLNVCVLLVVCNIVHLCRKEICDSHKNEI